MSSYLGFEAKLYLDLADSWDSPDWIELANVKNCKVGMKFDKAETTTRRSRGVKTFKPGLEEIAVTFEALDDVDDAQLATLRQKYAARGMVHVMALNGPLDESGKYGREFWGALFDHTTDQQLSEAGMLSMEIAPTDLVDVDQQPRWVEIA